MKQTWLETLENKKYWCEDAFINAPSIIAHEYHRILDLVKQGQVYGLGMQIKDTFETLLKYEVLIVCAWIYGNVNETIITLFEKSIGKKLVEKPLALGDWVEIANQLKRFRKEHDIQIPEYLIKCMENIRSAYAKKEVVKWRNMEIGHGALGFEEDVLFQNTISDKIMLLHDLFKDNMQYLKQQGLYLGITELKGCDNARNIETSTKTNCLFISGPEGIGIPAGPWIVVINRDIYFFDKQKKETITSLQSYIIGHHRESCSPFFSKIYRNSLSSEECHENICVNVPLSQGASVMLNALNEVDDFVEPLYITEWLRKQITAYKKGLFMLKMKRGMGKSAFTEKLSHLCTNPIKLDDHDTEVRTYHIDRSNLRGAQDFEAEIEGQWKTTYTKDSMEIWADSAVVTMSKYREMKKNIAESMAAFLRDALVFSQAHRGYCKVLLIIDGIDEIPPTGKNAIETKGDRIWDHFIGIESFLPEGVYILLTSRLPEEEDLPQETKEKLEELHISEQKTLTVRHNDINNIEFLQNFLKECQIEIDEQSMKELLKYSDYRILGLRMLSRLIRAGVPLESLISNDGKSVEQVYFEVLEKSYGEKETNRLKELLALLATLGEYEALSVPEIAYYINGQEVNVDLLSKLNDIEPMLIVERGYKVNDVYRSGENRYMLANKELSETFRRILSEETIHVANSLINYAFSLISSNDPDMDYLLLIWSHLTDLCKTPFDYDANIISTIKKEITKDKVDLLLNVKPKNSLQSIRYIHACWQVSITLLWKDRDEETLKQVLLVCKMLMRRLEVSEALFNAEVILEYVEEKYKNKEEFKKPEITVEYLWLKTKLLQYKTKKIEAEECINEMVDMMDSIESFNGFENEILLQWCIYLDTVRKYYLREGRYKTVLKILDLYERIYSYIQLDNRERQQIFMIILTERIKVFGDCGLEEKAFHYLKEIRKYAAVADDYHDLLSIDSMLYPYANARLYAGRYVVKAIERTEKKCAKKCTADKLRYIKLIVNLLSNEIKTLPIERTIYAKRYKRLLRQMTTDHTAGMEESKEIITDIDQCRSRWEKELDDYLKGVEASSLSAAKEGVYYSELLVEKKEYNYALDILEKVLRIDREEGHFAITQEGYYLRGKALYGCGRNEEAINAYKKALECNSEYAVAAGSDEMRIVSCLYSRLRIEEALVDALVELERLDEAIEIDAAWFKENEQAIANRKRLFSWQLLKIYRRLLGIKEKKGEMVLDKESRKFERKLKFESATEYGRFISKGIVPEKIKIPKDEYINWVHRITDFWELASYYYLNEAIEARVYPMMNPYKPVEVHKVPRHRLIGLEEWLSMRRIAFMLAITVIIGFVAYISG